MVTGRAKIGTAQQAPCSRRHAGRLRYITGTLALLLGAASSVAAAQSVGPGTPRRDSTATERRVGAAYALERAGNVAGAIEQYRRIAADSRAANDKHGLAAAEYRLGIAFWAESRHDSALVHLEVARDLLRDLPDVVEYARALNGFGATNYQRGVYEPALEAFLEAESLRRRMHDSVGLARTMTNVGKTYHDWGQLERGRQKLLEAVDVATKASKAAPALGYALNSLALIAIDAGEYDTAAVYIRRSLEAYALPGGVTSRADSSDSWEINAAARGKLLLRRGDARAAIPVFDSVVSSATARRSIRGRAEALVYLGECRLLLGQTDAARKLFRDALVVAQDGGQRVLSLLALQHLAHAEESAGQPAAALAFLKRAQALRDTVFDQDAAQRIAAREARADADAARRDNALLQQEQRAQAVTISRQRVAVLLTLGILAVVSTLIVLLVRARQREQARAADLSAANVDLARLNEELRTALTDVRTLSGLIPICSNCKRVRDDRGYWQAVETWVTRHSDATFSHSICQSCGPVLYGNLWTMNGAESDEGAEGTEKSARESDAAPVAANRPPGSPA